jgi:hypothetical protein
MVESIMYQKPQGMSKRNVHRGLRQSFAEAAALGRGDLARPRCTRRQGWSGGGRYGALGAWDRVGTHKGGAMGCMGSAPSGGRLVRVTGPSGGGVLWTPGSGGGERASRRRSRRCQAGCRPCGAICGQAAAHRSLPARVRRATRGWTGGRAPCLPAPCSRRSTTTGWARATRPLPRGSPGA